MQFHSGVVKECFPDGMVLEPRQERGEGTDHLVARGTALQTEGAARVPEFGESSGRA